MALLFYVQLDNLPFLSQLAAVDEAAAAQSAPTISDSSATLAAQL